MNTDSRKSHSVAFIFAALAGLILVPTVSHAQYWNTATGFDALAHNTTGSANTADGYCALYFNSTNGGNTAIGSYALYRNTTGGSNTANGYQALYCNGTGSCNTANGVLTMFGNTTGYNNTANGYEALFQNITGYNNAANGYEALYSNTTGLNNTATGTGALYSNTVGSNNVANGYLALLANTTGNYNVADGFDALSSNSTGSSNIALGYGAGELITTGSNNIELGNEGTGYDSGVIRIGMAGNQTEAFIAGINGVTASGGVEVYVNSNGQLGTVTSSRRFKFDIQNLGATSEKLMDLRPVVFRYKEAAPDGTHPIQYGLIAEEVAKVYPDLVQYDKQGKPFTVYYHLLTPMMLNELQKAHHQLAAQEAEFSSLKAMVQTQRSEVASLRHTVLSLVVILPGSVLLTLGCAAYAFSAKARRLPLRRTRPVETCAA